MALALKRLLPPGDPAGVREIVAGLGLHELGAIATAGGASRPRVVLNMVSTLDGRATLQGRSGPLSSAADRALFHGLRTAVDAVMAGAGTVRTERYGPIVRDPDGRRARRELGLSERPLACVVSASLSLPPDLPLLADPDSRVVFLTSSDARLPATRARVEYVRARDPEGALDLAAALGELQERLGVRTVLCEGGPHLNAALLAAGAVDELFLSLSPLLAGEIAAVEHPAGRQPPLGILAGANLDPPLALELISALEQDSHLFLRYRLRAEGG